MCHLQDLWHIYCYHNPDDSLVELLEILVSKNQEDL